MFVSRIACRCRQTVPCTIISFHNAFRLWYELNTGFSRNTVSGGLTTLGHIHNLNFCAGRLNISSVNTSEVNKISPYCYQRGLGERDGKTPSSRTGNCYQSRSYCYQSSLTGLKKLFA